MSLDNLKISPFLIKELYTNSLIDTEKKENVAPSSALASLPAVEIKFLGKNSRNIIILVNEKDHLFLGDDELNFLMAILNACSITMENVALINTNSAADAVYEKLMLQFKPEVILFLGTEPQELDFPVQFPHYRIQKYNGQQYLYAPALQVLSSDKEEKKQLWTALKTLFEIG